MRRTVTAWFSNDARNLDSELVNRVARYWRSKAGGRAMPRVSDIDLLDLPEIAPNLVLADVCVDPFSARYRLVGPDVVRFMHWDFTGEDVSSLKKRPNSLEWREVYRFLAETRTACLRREHHAADREPGCCLCVRYLSVE